MYQDSTLVGTLPVIYHLPMKIQIHHCSFIVIPATFFVSVLLLAIATMAAEPRLTPLPGEDAVLRCFSDSDVDTFKKGALLFSDREYRVSQCPEWLEGKKFLRNSINSEKFNILEDGILTLLTPNICTNKTSASQAEYLEKNGFTRIMQPETFQLFGNEEWDLVRIYQKQVQKGERYDIHKFVILIGFASAECIQPKPWSQNDGEKLYNGIVLPKEWPPQNMKTSDVNPMPAPYLDYPPVVIPIEIGRQLFVDDFLIQETSLKRVFHKPEKYSGNPILKPETELEMNGDFNSAAVPKSGGLWWDPAEKIFKLWYEAGWIHTICYATSKDGLKWERPELDVIPKTNQVLPPDLTPDSWTVVPDWNAKDPLQRYKMFMRKPGGYEPGLSMTSADGIHWTNRVATGTCGDRSTMFYNPFRKKWIYSLRSSFRGRSRNYLECDDFLEGAKWTSEPVAWAAADNKDIMDTDTQQTPQLYNLDAVAYESIMLGMFEIHHGPPNGDCMKVGLPKITELNFAYSRDGFHWYRPDRSIDIRAERKDVWDRGYVQSLGNICCIHGDKLWIYYSSFQGDTSRTSGNWLQNGMYDRGATGVAFLRRDGFVSMQAGEEPGTLLTRPVTFSGSQLFVNAAAKGGSLRVAILDLDGNAIPPYTLEKCCGISCDSTLEQISWKGAEDLAELKGKVVRFRFTLKNASIYAFWVSKDKTGRSDGFVAGGGPGYTEMTDTVGLKALDTE